MRNFKGILVLAMAIALVFGATTMAKAESWPAGINDLTDFLDAEGAVYAAPVYVNAEKWRVTALAYEAGYNIDFYGESGGDILFSNRYDATPTPFGEWVSLPGDPADGYFYVNETNQVFDIDAGQSYLEIWQLTEDWYFDDLDMTLLAGTYILGLDDLGNNVDDNHDDFIMAFQAVPVPAAVWLLGSGLVGLAGLRRKFKS